MFEVSFPELVILAVVALLVLGPERLPRAARFVGLWVRKARAQWFAVKGEFEREMAADELRRSLQQAREVAEDVRGSLQDTARQADAAVRETGSRLRAAGEELESVAKMPPAGDAAAPRVDDHAPAAAALPPPDSGEHEDHDQPRN
ncbi:MAG: Sec-independent protein translocase protein TatB [Pseudoxanthomonas suwonensis]|nr:Sec-independent protein translocase protein TatB [Pseudoxanthomonas suwonensis]